MPKTRQSRWKQARTAEGKCPICGDPCAIKKNGERARECEAHLVYNRERMRRKLKLKRRYRGAASYKIETITSQKRRK